MIAIVVLFAIVAVFASIIVAVSANSGESAMARRVVASLLLMSIMMGNASVISSAIAMHSDSTHANACTMEEVYSPNTSVAQKGGKEFTMKNIKNIMKNFVTKIGEAIMQAIMTLMTMIGMNPQENVDAVKDVGETLENLNNVVSAATGDNDSAVKAVENAMTAALLDSHPEMRKAVALYRRVNDISVLETMTYHQIIEAIVPYASYQKVLNGEVHYRKRNTENNTAAMLHALMATGVVKVGLKTVPDSMSIIELGGIKAVYNPAQAVKIYGQDILKVLENGRCFREIDSFHKLFIPARTYLMKELDTAVRKSTTTHCYYGTLDSAVGAFDAEFGNNGKLKSLKTNYANTPYDDLEGPVFVVNGATKKIANINTTDTKVWKQAEKEYRKENGGNTPYTADDIMGYLLSEYKNTNVDLLTLLTNKFDIFDGTAALGQALQKYRKENPEGTIFMLNMMGVPQETIYEILRNGITVITELDETEDEKDMIDFEVYQGITKKFQHVITSKKLTFFGQTIGGEKDGTYIFVEPCEDMTDTPNTWKAINWAYNMGFDDIANAVREELSDVSEIKDGETAEEVAERIAKFDYEDALNEFFKMLAESKSLLTWEGVVSEDGMLALDSKDPKAQTAMICSLSKLVARMALQNSTVMPIVKTVLFDENMYISDGKYKRTINVDGAYSVNGTGTVERIETRKECVADGQMPISLKKASSLAVQCPDLSHNQKQHERYCEIIDKMIAETNSGSWVKWAKLKDGTEEQKALYKEFLEIDAGIPGAFQLRNRGGAKPLAVKTDFGAMNDNIVGIEYDPDDVGKDVAEALNKFNQPMIGKPLNTLNILMDLNSLKFIPTNGFDEWYIVGHSTPANGEGGHHDSNITTQGILTLGLDNPKPLLDAVREEIVDPIRNALKNPIEMIDWLNAADIGDITTEDIANNINELKVMRQWLKYCPGAFYAREFRLSVYKHIEKVLSDAGKGTFKVKGARHMYVAIDPIATLNIKLYKEMRAAEKANGVKEGKYNLKELDELVSDKTFPVPEGGTRIFVHAYEYAKEVSLLRYPHLSAPEWFRAVVVPYLAHLNPVTGCIVMSAKDNVIGAQQDGDNDGDHDNMFPNRGKIGKLIYENIASPMGINRIYKNDFEISEELKRMDIGVCDATNALIAFTRNNTKDDTGMIANAAMYLNDSFRHLMTIIAVGRCFGIKKAVFRAPGEKWNVKSLDDALFLKQKGNEINPLNNPEDADEDDYNIRNHRGLEGLYIPNELTAFGDIANDWAITNDKGERLFTGWIITKFKGETVIMAEMPCVSKKEQDDEGFEIWVSKTYYPYYGKQEGVDADFIPEKKEEIKAIAKNANFKEAMAFGHEVGNKGVIICNDKRTRALLLTNSNGTSLFDKNADEVTPLYQIKGKTTITVEKIAHAFYMLNLTDSQEAGREIDKKKHTVGARWNIDYPCVPSWKIHVSEGQGKNISQGMARSQYVSASALGALNCMIEYEKEEILAEMNKNVHSITPYFLSLIDPDDVSELTALEARIRDIKQEYLIAMSSYDSKEDIEEKAATIEETRCRLYALTYAMKHKYNISTVAIMTYFVGCESKAVSSGAMEGGTVHDNPTSFSMLLGIDIVGLLKSAPDAEVVCRLPKKADEKKLTVNSGWLWSGKKLVERVTNDANFTLTDIPVVTTSSGAKYAVVYKGQFTPENLFYTDKTFGEIITKGESKYAVDAKFYILMRNKNKAENLIKGGDMRMAFMFNKNTKALEAFLVNTSGNLSLLGTVDIHEKDNVICSKLDEADHVTTDIDVLKGKLLLSLVNSVCVVRNAKVTKGGNLDGMEIVSKSKLTF